MIRKIISIVVAFTFCFAAPTQPLELSPAKSPSIFKPDLRSVSHRRRQNASHNQSIPGQAVTLLPSGQFLVSGGDSSDGPVTTIWLRDPVSGTSTPLSGTLLFARSGHSSTLLPDGTVFIWGGVGESGSLVGAGEIFNPNTQQSQPLSNIGLLPRTQHTATLLTDGRVLVAGGIGRGQEVTGSIQIWNPATSSLQSLSHGMRAPREGHLASLNADGTVAFWKGSDQNGLPLNFGEVFDTTTQSSRFVTDPSSLIPSSPQPFVEVSLPPDGATDVSPSTRLALRFSKPLRVDTVSGSSLVLSGPTGEIPALVVPAEAGMLAFVTPSAPLDGGTIYSLSVSGCSDPSGDPLQQAEITFTTSGISSSSAGVAGGGSSGSSGDSGSGPLDNETFRLPPLQAPKGATALSGQVLKLNGAPLSHVLLQIDSQKAYTDETGRFLLENIAPGHHPMVIDGSTANQAGREYGIYDDGVDVRAGQTTVLNYKIWMTPLDREHEVDIPSPTISEFVVTTPRLPGLELHLPAGTVIKDRNGNVVTRLGITPIPVNHPPFPLPVGVEVPIYFTIQPGGSYIDMPTGTWAKGARLFYPNWRNSKPGTPFDFWNYDPLQKGWYIYGEGEVDKTAQSIVPNPGVEIYQFTGAMVGSPSAEKGVALCPGCPKAGEPVDLATGQFVYDKTDLALPDVIPLIFTRTYTQNDNLSRSFGIGTMSNYDIFIAGDFSAYSYLELQLPNGTRIYFDRTSPGASWSNAAFQHTSTRSEWYGATITYNSSVFPGAAWVLIRRDGMTYYFPDAYTLTSPAQMGIIGIKDRNGNTVFVKRDGNSNLSSITSPNGRSITFQVDSQNRITHAQDNIGRTASYSYDTPCGTGLLCQVTDVAGGTWIYTYDSNNNMLTIKDARGIIYLTNQYDVNNRVKKQILADGVSAYQFSWTSTNGSQFPYYVGGGLPPGGSPTAVLQFRACTTCSEGYSALESQVQVTDPNGNVHQVGFGPTGYPITETFALGKPEQQTYNYSYFADNLLQSITDPLNRVTSFNYDAMGNVLSVTRLSGTANAVTTNFSYEANFNQLLSVTDPLGHTTSFGYDALSNLTSITDPLANKTVLTNDSEGRLLTVTDPLQNTASFAYSSGDLVSVTDPLNRTVTRFTDGAGRVLSVTAPSGRTTHLAYNALNQVTTITDPMGNQTSLGYDPNGNLLSVTDANQHQTQYTYDSFDREQTRKDALGNAECYGTFSGSVCQANGYDGDDNLIQYTDRRGKVAVFSYDGLNRLKFAGYGMTAGPTYESTVNYTYDGGNRLTQMVDSITGTLTPGFDLLDRLTSEATPQGSISYIYDNANRRQTMTVAGQPTVSYAFDNANRLTQITQSTTNVSFGYDNANRRTLLTLPNGVTANYTYDAASQLTGLAYMNGSTTLGNLTYSYDLVGHSVSAGGTFASTNLPNAVTTAAYNANNQLTTWGTANLYYDLNGNMTSSGTDGYTWDARNRLVSTLSGASFQYDPFGRRTSKTFGGATISFLYDGANAVQEISGGSATANLLTGDVDEDFLRTDSAGARSFLSDALGSTLALSDSTGTVQTSYTFDPFGNTTVSGAATTSSYAYTGRELDPSGLYFYRARYYHPQLQRFISEDPIGLLGGINRYEYAQGNPISFNDPSGEYAPWRHSQITAQAALDSGYAYTLADALRIGKEVADVDNRPGTQRDDAYDSNTHAMAGRKGNGTAQDFYQDCNQAYSATAQQIRDDVEKGDINGAAHTIEDSYSPTHFGFQPWDGGSTPWHIPSPQHMLGEDFQGENSPDVIAATAAVTAFFKAVINYRTNLNGPPMPDPTVFLAPHPCGTK